MATATQVSAQPEKQAPKPKATKPKSTASKKPTTKSTKKTSAPAEKKTEPKIQATPEVLAPVTPDPIIGGKMIAVCGSPSCGKTSVALKLAQEIYFTQKKPVLFLSPDLATPTMGYIFPNGKDSDLHSVGVALDKTDIFREDVMKQIVNVKTMRDFGLLGYKLGENRYSYPRPTEDKISELFRAAAELAAYIVVDCTCETTDLISMMAFSAAHVAVQIVTPTVKNMTYYASNAVPFHENKITVMNICDNDLYLPIEEVKSHFKDIGIVLPYSHALKQQGITGTLSERLNDRKYHAQMSQLARRVI